MKYFLILTLLFVGCTQSAKEKCEDSCNMINDIGLSNQCIQQACKDLK